MRNTFQTHRKNASAEAEKRRKANMFAGSHRGGVRRHFFHQRPGTTKSIGHNCQTSSANCTSVTGKNMAGWKKLRKLNFEPRYTLYWRLGRKVRWTSARRWTRSIESMSDTSRSGNMVIVPRRGKRFYVSWVTKFLSRALEF